MLAVASRRGAIAPGAAKRQSAGSGTKENPPARLEGHAGGRSRVRGQKGEDP
jgi:hypothetical protein